LGALIQTDASGAGAIMRSFPAARQGPTIKALDSDRCGKTLAARRRQRQAAGGAQKAGNAGVDSPTGSQLSTRPGTEFSWIQNFQKRSFRAKAPALPRSAFSLLRVVYSCVDPSSGFYAQIWNRVNLKQQLPQTKKLLCFRETSVAVGNCSGLTAARATRSLAASRLFT
jgi:hypothetical protein